MIEEAVDDDIRFLKELAKQSISPNIIIDSNDMERMLGMMNRPEGQFAIAPYNFIFNSGFVVYHIKSTSKERRFIGEEPDFKGKWILDFREYQMPEGYDWKKMAGVYMHRRNRDLLKLASIEEPRADRVIYEY